MQFAAGVAIGLGSLLVALGIYGIATELPDLWDPCQDWGIGSSHSVTISPGDACQSRSGTSETKADFLVRLAIVPGFVALCGSAAAIGGLRRRRAWLVAAAVGLAAETVVLFMGLSIAFVATAAVAVVLVLCAKALGPAEPAP